MTRMKKFESVSSRMLALQNHLINYQEQVQEINPSDIEALQQASWYKRVILEWNRWRAQVKNLENDNRDLEEDNRELKKENRELEEENRDLEEKNRKLRRRIEEEANRRTEEVIER
ncbi:hypothetical protein C2G38_2232919 [Gigaspora rosea]|uniref:Uncharacterized protein n=1 Tax=Gigaspora rosea TaxID=44941 RepID=A0A397TVQ5_9GLOM|nr:hypothetical protein C2G38_2232919 [Gigaspora rosea]